MGFTIDFVNEVSFIPCIGWPEPVDYNNVPDDVEMVAVFCGHFYSSLTGEMKLDNFTGYVRMTYYQQRCAGYDVEREEKRDVIEQNRKKVSEAFSKKDLQSFSDVLF